MAKICHQKRYGVRNKLRGLQERPRATIDFPVSIRAHSMARTNNHHQLVKIYRAAASRNEAVRTHSTPIVTLHARHTRLLLGLLRTHPPLPCKPVSFLDGKAILHLGNQ